MKESDLRKLIDFGRLAREMAPAIEAFSNATREFVRGAVEVFGRVGRDPDLMKVIDQATRAARE